MAKYINKCTNCSEEFEVDSLSKHNHLNKRKFVRACSNACTSVLRSKSAKSLHEKGKLTGGIIGKRRHLDKQTLIELYCYKHMKVKDIAKELKTKPITVSSEMELHGVEKVFYRSCPQCNEFYLCLNRSMVDPNSSKFKKYCSRACFLSSRGQCNTWIERVVSGYLTDKGIELVPQFEVDRSTIDFVVKGTKIAIEVNGDFWHANPDIYGKSKPIHRNHARVIEKDLRKLALLESRGFTVITVWEHDLKTKQDETLANLYESIADSCIVSAC